jgi:hypothetical protein
MARLICLVQGIYYAATGLWPILAMESFLWVTGPKVDLWLVNTFGLLVAVIGAVLLLAAFYREISAPVVLLGVGSAAALAIAEGYYALTGVIWSVYLLDAVWEIALIVLWGLAWMRGWRSPKTGSKTSPGSWTEPSRSGKDLA